jgi:hypothetical protein
LKIRIRIFTSGSCFENPDQNFHFRVLFWKSGSGFSIPDPVLKIGTRIFDSRSCFEIPGQDLQLLIMFQETCPRRVPLYSVARNEKFYR